MSTLAICRFCAETKISAKMINLDGDPLKLKSVASKLKFLNASYVNLGDTKLPKTICIVCLELLDRSHDFFNKVKVSQQIFNNLFGTESKQNTTNNDFVNIEIEEIHTEAMSIKMEPSYEMNIEYNETENHNSEIVIESGPSVTSENEPDPSAVSLIGSGLSVTSLIESGPSAKTIVVSGNQLSTSEPSNSQHMKITWSNYLCACGACKSRFLNIVHLRLHSMVVHRRCLTLACVDCEEFQDGDFNAFVSHVRTHWSSLRSLCEYCNKYVEEENLPEHLKEQHFTQNQIPCKTCGEIFDNQETFHQHILEFSIKIETIKPPQPHTCDVCKKVFKHNTYLQRHKKIHLKPRNYIKKKDYICDLCGDSYYSRHDLKIHVQSHEKNLPHACKLCYLSFDFPTRLKSHIARVHPTHVDEEPVNYDPDEELNEVEDSDVIRWNDYTWKCADCDIEYPTRDMLCSHTKDMHRRCAMFTCVDCKKFKNGDFDRFVEHVRKHRKCFRSHCEYCDILVEEKNLRSHQKEKHFQKGKVPCKMCGDILQNNRALQQHMQESLPKIHGPKQRRKRGLPVTLEDRTCDICQKVFTTIYAQRLHRARHNNPIDPNREKGYTCERCGKAYFTYSELNSHMMRHDQVLPYACKICNKRFLQPVHLRTHVRTHDNIKPYTCEVCKKCYRTQRQLKNHMVVHSGKKPYVCQYCQKDFHFKNLLSIHERIHTGEKPYSCECCGMKFTNWSNFNKHMKRRHGLDTSKKKITPIGVFPINPETGQLIGIQEVEYQDAETEEWKKNVMVPLRTGKKIQKTDSGSKM